MTWLRGVQIRSTTIRVSTSTRNALRQLGLEGESYEDIVRRLLEQAPLIRVYERATRILETDDFARHVLTPHFAKDLQRIRKGKFRKVRSLHELHE